MLNKNIVLVLCTIAFVGESYQVAEKAVEPSVTAKHDQKVFDAIEKISSQLEKFNLHYLTKLEDKFVNIMQSMSSLDSNIKQLQEKAQVWDVFRHHIDSWTEHMKSTDQKIEILKKSMDSLPIIENQLQNTDFKVQHVFDQSNLINEKFHELTKSVLGIKNQLNLRQQARKPPPAAKQYSQEDFEQTEILMRLSKIHRMLQNTCGPIKLSKNIELVKNSKMTSIESEEDLSVIKTLLTKVSSNLEKIPVKDIKQTFHLNRKHDKVLETMTTMINQIDERTIRLFDTNSYQFRKLMTCCKSTENELLTFTNNGDTLLKKLEKVTMNIDNKAAVIANGQQCGSRFNITQVKTSGNEVDNDGGSGDGDEDVIDEKDFIQQRITNCFQLTTGVSGVYTFGYERELNDGGRDFLQQYCEYSTEGQAWTVIQRRDNFDPPENFNRSWNDYRNGFGSLSQDFWFGNDYIHKLTYDQNMVLRIQLEDFSDNHVWVEYGIFRVESEKLKYNLLVDEYRGSIADSFLYHNDMEFSTFDQNHDKSNSSYPCAVSMGAGWWFNGCAESNLNGVYQNEPKSNHSMNFSGIFWEHWLGDYSLKASKMMIRPKDLFNSFINDEDLIEFDKSKPLEDP